MKTQQADAVKEPPFKYEKWADGYYSHSFYCANCNTHNEKLVKKGVRVKGLTITCDNCGCEITEK